MSVLPKDHIGYWRLTYLVFSILDVDLLAKTLVFGFSHDLALKARIAEYHQNIHRGLLLFINFCLFGLEESFDHFRQKFLVLNVLRSFSCSIAFFQKIISIPVFIGVNHLLKKARINKLI